MISRPPGAGLKLINGLLFLTRPNVEEALAGAEGRVGLVGEAFLTVVEALTSRFAKPYIAICLYSFVLVCIMPMLLETKVPPKKFDCGARVESRCLYCWRAGEKFALFSPSRSLIMDVKL